MREHRAHSRSRSILLALLFGLGGCSFLVMRAPRPGYEPAQGPPACTETAIVPALELGGAATGAGLAGLVFLSESVITLFRQNCDEEGACSVPDAEHGTSARIGVASAVLLASGVYGLVVSGKCRRAHDRYRASLHSAPPGLAPAQP